MATNLLGGINRTCMGEGYPFDEIFQGKMTYIGTVSVTPHMTWRNGYLAILVHQQANERLTTTGVSNRTIAQAAFQRQGISRFSVTMAFTM